MRISLNGVSKIRGPLLTGQPQHGETSYYPRGCPHDGVIQEEWNSSQIRAFIKAMTNPPLPFATFRGNTVCTYEDYLRVKRGSE